jgi:class 3 adenylate cyclase
VSDPESPDPHAELELLRARDRLARETDDALEEATRDRLSLEPALGRLMPLLAPHAGAAAVTLETFDEELQQREFAWSTGAERVESLTHALDVAGEDFGRAHLHFDHALDERERTRARLLLETWCEELDNYLAAIAQARRKHAITSQLSDALKHPVLERGISEALAILQDTVGFDDLVLGYHHEDDRAGETLSFKVIRDKKTLCSSSDTSDSAELAYMQQHASSFIDADAGALLTHFGIDHPQEEVLINGIKDQRVIGRLVVSRKGSELNTYDRDLLQRFADYLRQRVVDFNREYKHLALNFPADVVRGLLAEEGYVKRYLQPSEHDVAILYADIAGFTRVSEQILRSPLRIGKLIDTWSEGVVRIVWQHGGVFDKMVGDCVIAQWGPPMFRLTPQQACAKALEAAKDIRAFTRTLSHSPELPELAASGTELDVATGLNFCSASVGFFGPNLDYTAFSAGMNNTSRLQGIARSGEVLCMESFVEALGDPALFGEPRTGVVKNVANPLAFRALLSGK